MKVIVASDIHGNLEYTRKLETYINNINPDKIVLLGDLYYHGPRNTLPGIYNPMEVSKILNKYSDKIVAVRGNCDAEVDNTISEFDLISDYKKIELGNKIFYLTHGHLFNKLDSIIKDNYVFYGHTHIYDIHSKRINPGSVGLPKVHKEHTIILYEDSIIKLIDLDNYKVLDSEMV